MNCKASDFLQECKEDFFIIKKAFFKENHSLTLIERTHDIVEKGLIC